MIQRLIGVNLILVGLAASAQVSEDFSDGELSSRPSWTMSVHAGSEDSKPFKVEDERLRLAADPASGKAWISTPSESIFKSQWQVDAQLDFNPSSLNLFRFYLASNRKELDQPLNGYFVQVGGSQDEVSLFRQSGTSIQKIIDGQDGSVNQNLVNIRIRVTADENGKWKLFVDFGLNGQWKEEGEAIDRNVIASSWAGLLCQFTATRSDKFWFDNFSINGSKYPDLIPPKLSSSQFIDSLELSLVFSEPLDPLAVNPSSFSLSTKSIQFKAQNELRLQFTLPWTNGTIGPLKITAIRDLAGNVMRDTTIQLLYFKAREVFTHDIVINEVMADPVPSSGLPQTEYVEIFNRSSNPINLDRWILTDDSQSARLPPFILMPKGYAVFYPTGDSPPANTKETLGISNFPSLNNSGDRVMLYTQSGIFMDSLRYSSDWYRDSEKAEGGWSLERIDPNDFCGEEENWMESDHVKGGTPGLTNSVNSIRVDRTPPLPVSGRLIGDLEIQLTFNERMQPDSIRKDMVAFNPESEWSYVHWQKGFKKLVIHLKRPLDEGQLFTIRIKNIRDCSGNIVSLDGIKFILAKPQVADSMDVVVNEILFNPYPGGVDYIELYNQSQKYFDLETWRIYKDSTQGSDEILQSSKLLAPGAFVVLTDDPEALKLFYPEVFDSVLLKSKLPTLPDDEGEIFLRSTEGKWIDHVSYDKNFHLPLIRNEEGISLERIDPHQSGLLPGNWRSSASGINSSGKRYGGTPGAPNSNQLPLREPISDFQVLPEVFDPLKLENGFTRVCYRFNRSDLFGTVFVFDWNGNRIKQIANNELMPEDGFFRWDGDDEFGNPVQPGFYLVVMEVYDSSKFYRVYRRRVIISPG